MDRVTHGRFSFFAAAAFFISAPAFSEGGRAPADLGATAGDGAIVLTWAAPTADAATVERYSIEYREYRADLRPWGSGKITTPGPVTRWEFLLFAGPVRYYTLRVRAVRNGVAGEGTDEITYDVETSRVLAVPSAPDSLTASVGDGAVGLRWADPDDVTISGYEMRFTSGGVDASPDWTGVLWRGIADSDSSTTRHRVESLTNGTSYTFEVRATSAAGAGDSSGVTATPVPPPSAPGDLTGAVGDGTVRLTWSDPVDATITGYELEYGDAEGVAQAWAPITTGDAGATSYTVRGLVNGREYTFRLRAVNGAGPGRASSVIARAMAPPDAPEGLSASATGRCNWGGTIRGTGRSRRISSATWKAGGGCPSNGSTTGFPMRPCRALPLRV